MRFHLDEHVAKAIATGLRERGVDVTTPPDVGLRGADDLLHMDFAHAEGRVIVTHDSDFLRYDAQKIPHWGIVYCRQEKYSIGDLLRLLLLIDELYDDDELRGQVEFL